MGKQYFTREDVAKHNSSQVGAQTGVTLRAANVDQHNGPGFTFLRLSYRAGLLDHCTR